MSRQSEVQVSRQRAGLRALTVLLGGAFVVAATSNAWASSGTIAGAPQVVFGQQQFGNTAARIASPRTLNAGAAGSRGRSPVRLTVHLSGQRLTVHVRAQHGSRCRLVVYAQGQSIAFPTA